MKSDSAAATPEEYIASVPENRRDTIRQLHDLICRTVPKQSAYMQSGMIGYGMFHYTYASGREGDWPLIALANQRNYISLYICAASPDGYLAEQYADLLGKVSVGRSCIRFTSIDDLRIENLVAMLRQAETMGGTGQTAM